MGEERPGGDDGAHDDEDNIVVVAVVPEARDPRWVRWDCLGERQKPEQDDHEQGSDWPRYLHWLGPVAMVMP